MGSGGGDWRDWLKAELPMEITQRMQVMRNTLRELLGEGYEAKVEPVRSLIRLAAVAREVSELTAAIDLMREFKEKYPTDRFGILYFTAAAVDLVEGVK